MKKILWVSLVIAGVLFACKSKYDDCSDEDYAKCITQKPDISKATVRVTLNEENPWVEVKLFEGDFENDQLVYQDTLYESRVIYYLATEKYYSATATYNKGEYTLIAVDGGEISIFRYRMCELRCYEARELELDLRLD